MNDPRDHDWQDPELSAQYQALPKVEPPAALDARILTAARAAVAPRPVSILSRFRGFRFWAAPVALAATLILAVGLAPLIRQADERDVLMDFKTPSSAKPAAEADAAPAGRRESQAADRALPAAPVAAPAAPEPPSLPLLKEQRKTDLLQSAPAVVEEKATVQPFKAERSPEAWLADIAELRRQGRTAEAEARLAEFRRHYPDYPLP